ncbi:hypothetical protein PR202_ga03812 [Eleusine coracana subsp. coracana]|uniref:Uncharacterized protein n=1 Tax=Eleusine coracana subsp. coracana TaxID=191504 RepID=A0AAV5BRD8_ELECO|nr:hypothetical protein PR202_ga03812 [Eleusine coracana subsp. coracana]
MDEAHGSKLCLAEPILRLTCHDLTSSLRGTEDGAIAAIGFMLHACLVARVRVAEVDWKRREARARD